MNKEEEEYIIDKLKDLQEDYDIVRGHEEADYILCECLIKLGFKEIVEEYNKISKYYT